MATKMVAAWSIASSLGIACVYECHILSVNFNGQQQNKSFDIIEINLWLEFADIIFGGASDSRKYVCVRKLGLQGIGINSQSQWRKMYMLWFDFIFGLIFVNPV